MNIRLSMSKSIQVVADLSINFGAALRRRAEVPAPIDHLKMTEGLPACLVIQARIRYQAAWLPPSIQRDEILSMCSILATELKRMEDLK